jgi:hypothetical protein
MPLHPSLSPCLGVPSNQPHLTRQMLWYFLSLSHPLCLSLTPTPHPNHQDPGQIPAAHDRPATRCLARNPGWRCSTAPDSGLAWSLGLTEGHIHAAVRNHTSTHPQAAVPPRPQAPAEQMRACPSGIPHKVRTM